jgi:hypothetical protein
MYIGRSFKKCECSTMIKLYRYQSINKNTLSALSYGKYWSAKPTTFNDPFEFRLKTPSGTELEKIRGIPDIRNLNPHLENEGDLEVATLGKQYVQNLINNFGVVCFTETSHNILMWSHYSSNHQGMCLGFEVEDPSSAGIYKVNYSDDYPELDFNNLWHKDGMMKVLWTKSSDWAYEKEWRMITVDGGKLETYKGNLVDVILGCRAKDHDKQEIKSLLKGKKIDFWDAKLDDKRFKINIQKQS